jgi:hypothetical protein
MCGTSGCVNGKMVYVGRDLVGLNRLYVVFSSRIRKGIQRGASKGVSNLLPREKRKPIEIYISLNMPSFYGESHGIRIQGS